MFSKILIANRGEIACRIIKTAQRMGIQTVAVYSEADKSAMHVRMADEAVCIGPAPSSESYLKIKNIINAAEKTEVQAIHPGYGFLSENAQFANACKKAGIVFIGPSAKAIKAMGLKNKAKDIMSKVGVPVVPGYQGDNQSDAHLKMQAQDIGFPLLIKAVAGGGGKGMRLVEDAKDFIPLLENCRGEGLASFGNDTVLLEKFIQKPRHIEVQVFGDSHGNAVHLYERDCSLQRRHQKVVEEAPAPGVSEEFREKICDAAVKAAQAINYEGAGTIEFIVDSKSYDFYFMEMNTRLQVEHPVTEMITGQDLVEWQIRVAYGEKLPLSQDGISMQGHAFEVRLYAEDPAQNFMPQTGKIRNFEHPDDDETRRIDTGIDQGDEVRAYYDPMIAKFITHGKNRNESINTMSTVLNNSYLSGLNTNQEFLHHIFKHKDFIAGRVDTGFIERHEKKLLPKTYGMPDEVDIALLAFFEFTSTPLKEGPWAQGNNWRMSAGTFKRLDFECRGQNFQIDCTFQGFALTFTLNKKTVHAELLSREGDIISARMNDQEHSAIIFPHNQERSIHREGKTIALSLPVYNADAQENTSGRIVASVPGRVVSVFVKKGQKIEEDTPLLVMESMKVEITMRSNVTGIVQDLLIKPNDQISDGDLLVYIQGNED